LNPIQVLLLSEEYLLILLKQELLSALNVDHALGCGRGSDRAESGGICGLWKRKTVGIQMNGLV